jgi:hypothetical protein
MWTWWLLKTNSVTPRLARESVVVANAVMLARWIGTGRRPVTAALVLRKADIPAAGAALGVEVPRDPGQDYPVCVGYKGDSPVEYWSEDDPEEPEPFNLAEVNRKLAALGEAGE